MRHQITLATLFFVLISFSHNALATGNCNGDEIVTIDEVQSAINMFLGVKPPLSCVDEDNSEIVSISEVQKTINTFLGIFSVIGAVTLDGSGFAGVTLTLYRTNFVIYSYYNMYGADPPVLSNAEAVSTTGADGSYSFNGVGSGSYAIVPSRSGYVFNPDKTKFFTIINNDSKVYIYDPETGINSVLGNPPTIIYDNTMSISGNTVPGWNFTASKPGGTGL